MGYKGMALLGGLILGGSLPFSAGIQTAEAVFLAHGRATAIAIENMVENARARGSKPDPALLGVRPDRLTNGPRAFPSHRILPFHGAPAPLGAHPVADLGLEPSPHIVSWGPHFWAYTTVAAIICFRLDVIMLSVMRNETEVGLYGAAYRLLALAFLVPESLVSAMFPVLSCSLQERRQEARDLVVTGMQLLLTLELPLCLAVAALAWWLMPLIFGSAFADASLVLMVLIFTLFTPQLERPSGLFASGGPPGKDCSLAHLGGAGRQPDPGLLFNTLAGDDGGRLGHLAEFFPWGPAYTSG